MKWVFWHVGKVKSSVQPHGIHEIKPSNFFPYIIGRFQKDFWFLILRIAEEVVKSSHWTSVSDRTCRTGHFFTWGKND